MFYFLAALATLYDYYVDVAAYSVIQLGALGGYGVSLIPSFEGLYLQFTGYSDGQVFKNFMQDFLNGERMFWSQKKIRKLDSLLCGLCKLYCVVPDYQTTRLLYTHCWTIEI